MKSKPDSREKILQTASRLFQLQGYHATGLNQILKESGAPKGSLYYYFPNGKEELAVEAVRYTSHYIGGIIQENMEKTPDPVKAVQLFIAQTASQFDQPESIQGVPVGLLAAETALISEPLRTACVEAFTKWEALFAQKFIQSGMNKEEASKLGILISSMVGGSVMRSLTEKDKTPLLLLSDIIPRLIQIKG
ncbi:TetR/AcrR family transcriptional regulator [Domibacillus robiginosus]|uniref:TetR/AcrR family transcriptional regulator n=1 Tax=Domibacillus robiginosus TaxID=1071054 RepID=UPI00067B69F4|nr:TetR/AcrR family transcriptional regulator [Domibacillus robiginosus]